MRSLAALFLAPLVALAVTAQEPASQVRGTVNEIMIGITYPTSNTVSEAVFVDPEAPSDEISFDPYGGWLKVQTAAIAMAESANLLGMPGRLCSNGEPAPVDQDDWTDWVDDLRATGMSAYAAAKAESQEMLLEMAEELSASCVDCHTRYLDVGGDPLNRCMP
jgi:hypothetical protein